MPKKSNTTWFIWTGGNRLADNMIADSGMIGPEDECLDMLCKDSERRNLYRCPDYEFVRVFEQSAKAIAPLHYKVFYREGLHGPIIERRPFMDPRRRKSRTVRRTLGRLAEIRASRASAHR